jgi:hypothetical protein
MTARRGPLRLRYSLENVGTTTLFQDDYNAFRVVSLGEVTQLFDRRPVTPKRPETGKL